MSIASSAQERGAAEHDTVALDGADDAPAGRGESKSATSGIVRPACSAASTMARAERVLGGTFDAGGEAQQLVGVDAGGGHDRGDGRPALGQRAGLVDDEGVDLLHPFECLGVLDQHTEPAPRPTPTMIDIGRGQAERARAGDDQDGDGDDQRVGEPRRRGRRWPRRRTRRRRSPMTAGTNQAATRSASRWIGARERCASATICTIRASMVSRPTLLGAHRRARRSG